jgi:hypothetical protein
MTPAASPFFSAWLFPVFRRIEDQQSPRFLLQTLWEVRQAEGNGVPAKPAFLESLLVLDDLFVSVLPHAFSHGHGVEVLPSPGAAAPWRGIPCDLGSAAFRLVGTDGSQQTFRVRVRLPRQPLTPVDPTRPLLGTEFLRHYEPRLLLDYERCRWGASSNLTDPVGSIDWS